MQVVEVTRQKQLRQFIRLPWQIHHHRKQYIPPIWLEERGAYSSRNNPILAQSNYALLLLLDDAHRPIGRTIVYIDYKHNAYYNIPMGFFGAFECIDDDAAAKALMRHAEIWLRARGMESIRGPIHPVAENWGFLIEGYDMSPVFMSPWNPPYYHNYFQDNGYMKAKDLLAYEIDMAKGYTLPARYERFKKSFDHHYPNITVRRLNTKRIADDARAIWEISNVALADNWGYVPLDLPVMEDMLRKLRLIIDPDAVWIVEDDGRPVGFCLGYPDINLILRKINGRLLPFGWLRLLTGVKKLRDYRLFGLAVRPEWQKSGLDAMMYVHLYQQLQRKKIRMEANYILEDNNDIKNALEKLGMTLIKRYRIYEKSL